MSSIQSASQITGFLRLPQVLAVFPVSRSSWWAGVKAQIYPSPVKLSARTVAWKAEDIQSLVNRLKGSEAK